MPTSQSLLKIAGTEACEKSFFGSSSGPSCRTTLKSAGLIFSTPSYSINPSFRNLFMNWFTRVRVVPIISASTVCETFGSVVARPGLPWSQPQQGSCQPFLAGIEELIDQILLDPQLSGNHVGDEPVGELVFGVKEAKHFAFFNDQAAARSYGRRGRHPQLRAGQTTFAQKIPGPRMATTPSLPAAELR